MMRNTLETKYGKAHKAIPERSATTRCCFLPYTKYPKPIEPNNRPQSIDAELSIVFSYLCVFFFINTYSFKTSESGNHLKISYKFKANHIALLTCVSLSWVSPVINDPILPFATV